MFCWLPSFQAKSPSLPESANCEESAVSWIFLAGVAMFVGTGAALYAAFRKRRQFTLHTSQLLFNCAAVWVYLLLCHGLPALFQALCNFGRSMSTSSTSKDTSPICGIAGIAAGAVNEGLSFGLLCGVLCLSCCLMKLATKMEAIRDLLHQLTDSVFGRVGQEEEDDDDCATHVGMSMTKGGAPSSTARPRAGSHGGVGHGGGGLGGPPLPPPPWVVSSPSSGDEAPTEEEESNESAEEEPWRPTGKEPWRQAKKRAGDPPDDGSAKRQRTTTEAPSTHWELQDKKGKAHRSFDIEEVAARKHGLRGCRGADISSSSSSRRSVAQQKAQTLAWAEAKLKEARDAEDFDKAAEIEEKIAALNKAPEACGDDGGQEKKHRKTEKSDKKDKKKQKKAEKKLKKMVKKAAKKKKMAKKKWVIAASKKAGSASSSSGGSSSSSS